jgi:hypothetical protein
MDTSHYAMLCHIVLCYAMAWHSMMWYAGGTHMYVAIEKPEIYQVPLKSVYSG